MGIFSFLSSSSGPSQKELRLRLENGGLLMGGGRMTADTMGGHITVCCTTYSAQNIENLPVRIQPRTDCSRTAFRWKSRKCFCPLVKPPTFTTCVVSMPMRSKDGW
jgi:hypothetical protein